MRAKVRSRLRLFAALLMGFGAAMRPAAAVEAIQGRWGGDRLQLVFDSLGARLSSDCAGGQITGPVVPHDGGQFSAVGSFSQHSPGPQRADERLKITGSARFSGTVEGDEMALTIISEDAESPQVYRLHKGRVVKLLRCH